jgi:5-methyltetrahydrofolate--homocysteine methyltransferase
VNCGTRIDTELDDFLWLVDLIQEVVSVPLSLDSADSKVLSAGLKRVDKRPIINSITLEKDRFNKVAPILEGDTAHVIALCMDDSGLPNKTNAVGLVEKLETLGISQSSIFLDPLIQPIATNKENGNIVLNAMGIIREKLPDVNLTCGLSNISFGLPKRFLVNRTFIVATMVMGLNSAIIDPLDIKLMTNIITAEMILGRDEYCVRYTEAIRAGKMAT